jgi:hypothetical protein
VRSQVLLIRETLEELLSSAPSRGPIGLELRSIDQQGDDNEIIYVLCIGKAKRFVLIFENEYNGARRVWMPLVLSAADFSDVAIVLKLLPRQHVIHAGQTHVALQKKTVIVVILSHGSRGSMFD